MQDDKERVHRKRMTTTTCLPLRDFCADFFLTSVFTEIVPKFRGCGLMGLSYRHTRFLGENAFPSRNMQFFECHMAGKCMKLQEGLRSQESRPHTFTRDLPLGARASREEGSDVSNAVFREAQSK